jgi:hypothetical protein
MLVECPSCKHLTSDLQNHCGTCGGALKGRWRTVAVRVAFVSSLMALLVVFVAYLP